MRRDDNSHRSIDARKLGDGCRVFDVSHARAAILWRKDHPHQPKFAQLFDRGQRKLRSFVPAHDVRRNLALRKLAHRLFELQLLFV